MVTSTDSKVSYWCAVGVHGDNRGRHLVGMTLREIQDAGEQPFTFDGTCRGTVRPGTSGDFNTIREEACACDCHD